MVDLIDPRNTEQFTLKAMARNYADGHCSRGEELRTADISR